MATVAPRRRRAWPAGLTALDSRDFRLLWSGALVSNIGTWLQAVAQGWLVLEITNSAFLLGAVNAVGTLQNETAPQTLVGVEHAAPMPMLSRHEMDANPVEGDVLPPIELGDE